MFYFDHDKSLFSFKISRPVWQNVTPSTFKSPIKCASKYHAMPSKNWVCCMQTVRKNYDVQIAQFHSSTTIPDHLILCLNASPHPPACYGKFLRAQMLQ